MFSLKFYGSSDDNFCCDGERFADEIGCYDSEAIWLVKDESEAACHVVGHYAPGCAAAAWSVGLMQLEEDVPLPDWGFSFAAGNDCYSPTLTITAQTQLTAVAVFPKSEETE